MHLKTHISVPAAMPEAYEYKTNPASFSRGMHVRTFNHSTLFISGTASVGTDGQTEHKGDFVAQAKLMFNNVTAVLASVGMDWNNIAKVTIYLRDIDRDYETFNKVRKEFFDSIHLEPYPASTCVEAKLCRSDLLCEMDGVAVK